MAEKYRKWDIVNYLNSVRDACGYLEACLEEAPDDGDFLREVLSDIARAQEMGKFELQHEGGDKGMLQALAENGNLSYATVLKLTRTLGMQLRITA